VAVEGREDAGDEGQTDLGHFHSRPLDAKWLRMKMMKMMIMI
jgi:hypothetical protein